MRLTTGLLLAILISPLAQAELIDEINDRGELRIAVQAENAPYSFKENDHLSGFDIEFGQDLARELDLRAQFVEAPAADILPGVQSGMYDITLTPADATPQAESGLQASDPIGKHALVIAFQKDNPAFESALNNALQRLKDSGRTAQLETTWLDRSQEAEAPSPVTPAPSEPAPVPAH
ncbi:transporter substrate-binding domain-containing protein [Pseudomonas sp. S75]|uniref:substrate-binding periplasmic protein n=1 Tax=unclassified Pseudomonas TaxID=196821 RepID=UPI0019069438|nr:MULTISPECIES: transporter substrate-binding domain-containing protein [unclassified Pseudomonas]MBJ9974631.1 transporter substrate-binding domain-containing protein [Pseudomonas sp. S30]MBK0153410.1 transporter substrate-binding domain-containing protein [Pseudomonas sp. S75]